MRRAQSLFAVTSLLVAGLAWGQINPGVPYVPTNPVSGAIGGAVNGAVQGYGGGYGYGGNPLATPTPALPTLPPTPPIDVAPRENVGTAAAQGWFREDEAERLRYEAEQQAAAQSPRQQGLRLAAPEPARTVAQTRALSGWLADWTRVLTGAGVGAHKVAFEAERLSEEEFALWASRQIWAVTEGCANCEGVGR